MKEYMAKQDQSPATARPEVWDVVVVGGGPAGLTAALYASRSGHRTLLLESGILGGMMQSTTLVENYPGFPQPVSGPELGERMAEQAKMFGAELNTAIIVKKVKRAERKFLVETSQGNMLARSVIIATGAKPKRLDIPNEEKFYGRGVSYCATCDGPLFRGKVVAVVGGGNSALEESVFLTKFVDRLHLIHRRDQFRGDAIYQERVSKNPKIILEMSTTPVRILGELGVEGIEVERVSTKQREILPVAGVFIYAGHSPVSELVEGLVEKDSAGYIITDLDMVTGTPGLFACGDARAKALRQIATAVGEGAAAAFSAHRYLEMD
jgi:thioredoxin reductase (NADPH)